MRFPDPYSLAHYLLSRVFLSGNGPPSFRRLTVQESVANARSESQVFGLGSQAKKDGVGN